MIATAGRWIVRLRRTAGAIRLALARGDRCEASAASQKKGGDELFAG
jgi:hypothetical protein